jgi:hypothetical protein
LFDLDSDSMHWLDVYSKREPRSACCNLEQAGRGRTGHELSRADYHITRSQHRVAIAIAMLAVLAGVALVGARVRLVVGGGEQGSTEMILFGQTLVRNTLARAFATLGG